MWNGTIIDIKYLSYANLFKSQSGKKPHMIEMMIIS